MSNTSPDYFMNEAISLARIKMNANCGGPFGALIVKNGEIVGRGWNKITSTNDPTAHAEIVAIRDACTNLNTFNLEGCEIYATGEPCPMCMCAIMWARINKIYYAGNIKDAAAIGFDDSYFYEEIAKPIDKRSIPATQCCHDELLQLYAEWDAKKDKIMY